MKEDKKFTQMLQEQQIVIYKICRMYAQDEHEVKDLYCSCSLALSLQDCRWKSFSSESSLILVDTVSYGGAAIYPNRQYLYTSVGRYMYQYDLAAEDVAASRIRIAEYDGYLVLGYPSLPAAFHNMRLAADGKIYGTARGSSNVLHVIHNPDQPGLACNVEQHGLDLATLHAFAPPNYPYFQTWDEEGSPCDTLGINGPPPVSVNEDTEEAATIQVYPNPARDYIYITSSDQPIKQVQLWDSRGRLLKSFSGPTERIDVRDLPPGFYYLRVFLPDGYTSQKVVVQ